MDINLNIKLLIISSIVILLVLTLASAIFIRKTQESSPALPEDYVVWLKFILLSFGFLALCSLIFKLKKVFYHKLNIWNKNIESFQLISFIMISLFTVIFSFILTFGLSFFTSVKSPSSIFEFSFLVTILFISNSVNWVLGPIVITTFLELKEIDIPINKVFKIILTNAIVLLVIIQYYGLWAGIQAGFYYYPWLFLYK